LTGLGLPVSYEPFSRRFIAAQAGFPVLPARAPTRLNPLARLV